MGSLEYIAHNDTYLSLSLNTIQYYYYNKTALVNTLYLSYYVTLYHALMRLPNYNFCSTEM